MKKLADEIREKYASPQYTFEDITNEIRRVVMETYEYNNNNRYGEMTAFRVVYSDDFLQLKWTWEKDGYVIYCLKIPKCSISFPISKINEWFIDQGFIKYTFRYGTMDAWYIKFS